MSRKKRLEALETLYGKRESAIDDEPMILRSPELYNTYVYFCRASGREPADLDAIRRQYEEEGSGESFQTARNGCGNPRARGSFNSPARLPPCAGQDLRPRATKKPNDINPRFRYRPGGLNDLLRAPADLNAFMASLAVIATDVLRWEIPPDAAPAISAEAMTSSFGASAIERKSYSPNVK